MNIKNRLTKLEKESMVNKSIIFIDARSSEDFRAQIQALIKDGLDPAGKKFVYTEDPLRRLYDQIKGKSGGLVHNDNESFNYNRPLGEAGK